MLVPGSSCFGSSCFGFKSFKFESWFSGHVIMGLDHFE